MFRNREVGKRAGKERHDRSTGAYSHPDEILENRRIMQENFEKIWNKLNTNTIQLEKIKDKVNTMSKTDYDKAVEWLKDKMAGGRYDGAKLLMESQMQLESNGQML